MLVGVTWTRVDRPVDAPNKARNCRQVTGLRRSLNPIRYIDKCHVIVPDVQIGGLPDL